MNLRSAASLARHHMNVNGFSDWKFVWLSANRTYGRCNYRTKTISLSRPLTLVNDEASVLDTILHEIAHAQTPGAGHNHRWQAAARALGARPHRCATEADTVATAAKWHAHCRSCGLRAGAWYSKPRGRRTCRTCKVEVVYVAGPVPTRRPSPILTKSGNAILTS